MGRLLAIDYGLKRTGIAVSDPLQLIANGLTTVDTSRLMDWLKDYLSREKVDTLVLGLPRQMSGRDSATMPYIRQFAAEFQKRFPDCPVAFSDERFTSVLAHQAMLEGGLKKKDRQNKPLVDCISATIILQGYMESRLNQQR